jgi:hypothetical protein
VLRGAGYDGAMIARLVADGAVAGPPDPTAPPGGAFRA